MGYKWVFSERYKTEIDRSHAVYSSYEGSWLFVDEVVWSDYLGSYIYSGTAVKVWNSVKKFWDYVPEAIFIGHFRAYASLGESVLL